MVAEVPSCSPFPDVTLMQRPSSTPRWSRARLPAQMYRYASTTSSCSAPKAASLMFSASPSTASIPLWKRRLTPRRCGQRLCITHGKAPSRGYSSGTPFVVSRCPTVTLTSGLKPFPPIRAAKYLFVLTTAAVCWPSTCSAMSKSPSPRRQVSTSSCCASMPPRLSA